MERNSVVKVACPLIRATVELVISDSLSFAFERDAVGLFIDPGLELMDDAADRPRDAGVVELQQVGLPLFVRQEIDIGDSLALIIEQPIEHREKVPHDPAPFTPGKDVPVEIEIENKAPGGVKVLNLQAQAMGRIAV